MKTETTELSKFNKCLIRGKLVAATPEEQVRQALLARMISELGFPKGLISVEKGVGTRRYDIVCYSQEMAPLVLVECKAGQINDAAIRQALGYNHTINAPFICLASPNKTKVFWQEKGKIGSVDFLPMYCELYEISKRL